MTTMIAMRRRKIAMKYEQTMTGFKAFNPDFTCRGKQYAENTWFKEDGAESMCHEGVMHFCTNPFDVWRYYGAMYSVGDCELTVYAQVIAKGKILTDKTKSASTKLFVGDKLSLQQYLEICKKYASQTIDSYTYVINGMKLFLKAEYYRVPKRIYGNDNIIITDDIACDVYGDKNVIFTNNASVEVNGSHNCVFALNSSGHVQVSGTENFVYCGAENCLIELLGVRHTVSSAAAADIEVYGSANTFNCKERCTISIRNSAYPETYLCQTPVKGFYQEKLQQLLSIR